MDLKKALFVLPNFFTITSLCCGFYAIVTCMGEPDGTDFYHAALAIVVAMFCDAVDGRVARLTRTQSSFGTQIDSLCDVVSFGVAPAVLVFRWTLFEWKPVLGMIAAMAYVSAGAIRLARFNVITEREHDTDHGPGKYIVGMPIPTAAGVLVSLVVLNRALGGQLREASGLFVVLCLSLGVLMLAPIQFRSFKDLKLNFRTISLLTLVLVSSVAFAVFFRPSFVFVWLLGCYVALGLIEALISLSRHIGRRRRRV
jgi:CDP-diacylglycerol---serine O-phosphatidyltransferase